MNPSRRPEVADDLMSLSDMQKEIIANRVRRGFESATDLSKTTLGLEEEINEWKEAVSRRNNDEMIDALADIMVYCLGGIEILGADSAQELTKVIRRNASREYRRSWNTEGRSKEG